jgi:Asp-tRNA(Asn)/Glu-tRNA(Gln) amidotransferase A subunit family amidase
MTDGAGNEFDGAAIGGGLRAALARGLARRGRCVAVLDEGDTAYRASTQAAPCGFRQAFAASTASVRPSTQTTIAATAGAPQLSLPIGSVDAVPVGLSILARPGADDAPGLCALAA